MDNNIKYNGFVFVDGINDIKTDSAYLAVITNSVRNKSALLDILQEKLKFPDYFGKNWDALDEVMSDFSWLNNEKVIIYHEGISDDFPESDLVMYLSVLRDANKKWADTSTNDSEVKHKLLVVFPNTIQNRILNALEK